MAADVCPTDQTPVDIDMRRAERSDRSILDTCPPSPPTREKSATHERVLHFRRNTNHATPSTTFRMTNESSVEMYQGMPG